YSDLPDRLHDRWPAILEEQTLMKHY
ncbi:MAG: hypothetical protein K0S10_2867, partial [Rubrobacteraceae bacterium]|nr:hypothetical protein [Rubrobacteraceae bacterium]